MINKWLKIGAVVGIVLVVGGLALGAVTVALARGAIGPGHDWDFGGRAPFERGAFDRPAAFMAFAGEGPHGHGPGHRRPGRGGEVTAIDDTSLTLETRDGNEITVAVDENTKVMLIELQSEGSLSDIAVGDRVMVHGRRGDDAGEPARAIAVLPAGDQAMGRVTAVDGSTITVDGPDGEATIVTNDETEFRVGRNETGALSDVAEGKRLVAFGQTAEDGTLAARLVMVHDRPKDGRRGGPGRPGPREGFAAGEVTAIDGSSFTVDDFRGEADITVTTDDDTEYRSRSDEDVSFDTIEVGGTVMVKGRPVDGQPNTIKAQVVGIRQ